ncbi:MAG TPA: hypothetical protein VGR37_11170 [Longimicrobiaceae bacterium]|nr:hypothetical protein [Longimicrobiaceae bacterium]
MRLRSFVLALAIALATAVGACAPATGAAGSGRASGADPENQVRVEVRNTIAPPTSLTVYALESPGSTRRLLGSVNPGGTATFSFRPPTGAGNFRFMGRTTGGQELYSTPVTVGLGQAVVWDVQTNAVVVR